VAELLVLHLIELEGERFGDVICCLQRPRSPRASISTVPMWAAWRMTSGLPRKRQVARVGVAELSLEGHG
jgi:hypothetical protein